DRQRRGRPRSLSRILLNPRGAPPRSRRHGRHRPAPVKPMNPTRAIVLCLAASMSVTCAGGSTGGAEYPANEQAFDAGALPSITQFISSAKSGDGTIQAQLISGAPPRSEEHTSELQSR